MTQTTPARHGTTPARAGHRAGYVVAVAVNAALLYVVNNLLAWDVLPFLTDEFAQVLPLLNFSLAATIVFNALYVIYDGRWFKSTSQIVLLGISMAVTVRLYRVFPFDFSAYAVDWALVTRSVLIVAMFGVGVAIVVELGKLIFGSAQD